jgi:hypothetical protein
MAAPFAIGLAYFGEGPVALLEVVGWLFLDVDEGALTLGRVLPCNILSPAIVIAPMKRILVNHTKIATKTGTIFKSCSRLNTSLPSCDSRSTSETAHHVMIAFIVAPNSQAPVKYQISFGSFKPRSGVNSLANPAKSMAQKATARIVAQAKPANLTSPNKLLNAYLVVSKLNISKAKSARRRITPINNVRGAIDEEEKKLGEVRFPDRTDPKELLTAMINTSIHSSQIVEPILMAYP